MKLPALTFPAGFFDLCPRRFLERERLGFLDRLLRWLFGLDLPRLPGWLPGRRFRDGPRDFPGRSGCLLDRRFGGPGDDNRFRHSNEAGLGAVDLAPAVSIADG